MNFPYLKQIHVGDCYTHQNFDIPRQELKEFKHLILTGKNGSGKTTILNRLGTQLNNLLRGNSLQQKIAELNGVIRANPTHNGMAAWKSEILDYESIEMRFFNDADKAILENPSRFLFSFFKANRRVNFGEVTTVTRDSDFSKALRDNINSPEVFTERFKQYLVNKKIYEAFDIINNKTENIEKNKLFFSDFIETLRLIFNDPNLQLEFVQENFEFYIIYSDQRKVTFNQLSEGFSAFMSILLDLFIRSDLMLKSRNDFSGDIEGIVLIDEPETHFHLSMQYEILPLITKLFPKIQLVIATHSPAIISSIKNAIVFDLSSKEEVSDELPGSSYSELMVTHFGLDNEFSIIADKILLDVKNAALENDAQRLKDILVENDKYLTPSLKLEIESQIIKIQSLRLENNND